MKLKFGRETAEVRILRSARKTLALEITGEAEVLVRAPYRMREDVIRAFLAEKQDWLAAHLALARERKAQRDKSAAKRMSRKELEALAEKAVRTIPMRVAYYAPLVGVNYGRITIRNQKTRWGSCSSKGNLNFNCLLMLAPERVLDYVVVHELCHRLEMNHSPRFWTEVERVFPDYRSQKEWLKVHGGELMAMLPEANTEQEEENR